MRTTRANASEPGASDASNEPQMGHLSDGPTQSDAGEAGRRRCQAVNFVLGYGDGNMLHHADVVGKE